MMANTIFKLDGNWGGGRVELFLIPRIYQVDLGSAEVVSRELWGEKTGQTFQARRSGTRTGTP